MKDDPKTFFEHLGELRRRIIVSFLAMVAGTGVSLFFSDRLFDLDRGLLMLPLRLRPSDIMATLFGVISRAGVGGYRTLCRRAHRKIHGAYQGVLCCRRTLSCAPNLV